MLEKKEFDQIKEYIGLVRWKFASSMPKFPHEYTIRDWRPDLQKAFEMFARYINEHGWKGRFFRKERIYCYIEGHTYWTNGYPIEETDVINRRDGE